jgi:hypothetical protein
MMLSDSKVDEGQLPKTIPIQISLDEGLDIVMDVGSAVDLTLSCRSISRQDRDDNGRVEVSESTRGRTIRTQTTRMIATRLAANPSPSHERR